jgi:FkbM family methyltransferase
MGRLLSRINYTLQRRANVLACPYIPLSSRLRAVARFHPRAHEAIDQFVRDEGDRLEVDVGKYRFTVNAPAEPSERSARREFFSQVVSESFVDPLLFWGPVSVGPGDVVFDLGANIGTTAAVFSERVGPAGRVYAFEPCVVDELRGNLERNKLDNVEVVAAAVSDEPGEVEITFGPTAIDSSIVSHPAWHSGRMTVPAVTLDRFAEDRGLDRVDFIKVDIEGAEELAIRGAARVVERFRPRWSVSSYHRDMLNEYQHPKLVKLLGEMGYRVRQVQQHHIFAY